jgi:predicted ester cyclase
MTLAGHQQFAQAFYAGFPDVRHVIEDTVADADTVAVRFTLHGTHRGDFMGIPPTGKTIAVPRSRSCGSLRGVSQHCTRCSTRWG